MVLALLAVLTATPAAVSPDPPIRVSLNSGGYFDRGDRARVRIRLAEDGYVIVLRADADGRVRVLFPLDPGDDNFVRGGRDYELPGRGGRETFFVDDRTGAGTVLAARSDDPFQFDRFTRGDHWDYRVLAGDRMTEDPEAGLLDIMTAMSDSSHFDYDVVGYSVDGADLHHYSRYGYGPSVHIGFGYYYGSRYRCGYYDAYYDPYYCDPFYYDPFYPFYYDPYSYDYVYHRPYRYSCYYDPFCFGYRRYYGYGPARNVGGFTFKRPATPPPFVLPRERFPRTPAHAGEVTAIVTTGREPGRRPGFAPRRRESPQSTTISPPRSTDRSGRTASPPRDEGSRRTASRPRDEGSRRTASQPRNEGSGRSAAPRNEGSGRSTAQPRNEGSRRSASQPRASTPRSSTPSRSSGGGSKPSNSGTRRH